MTRSPLIDLSSAMRRAPAQERSKVKVRAILDAADELLGEIGYETLVATPWPIVERADVTVGVFYHYFEGGEAVLEALGLRYFQSAGSWSTPWRAARTPTGSRWWTPSSTPTPTSTAARPCASCG
ncbi:helix-turn-helix domain-containing protein [Nonomuraea thailandensis]